jgi:rhamnose utilization protein RhaD (predicted bifunctional aldolase and dehydrogenase)/NAD(P)-dependent dehydrogenase (short-subunit alcohol dehydrogenase family)
VVNLSLGEKVMQNRWKKAEIKSEDLLDQLVYQSRLVGAEESLVLWGGGNNSVKLQAKDILGQPIDVMYIKGSGSDMKSITPAQYPAVRLDWILPLQERAAMTDEEMVAYLARCLVDPTSPRPSIETLLHAFLPWRAVLHTHADAILTLTNTVGREKTVQACFGDNLILVPYKLPGFELSKMVGEYYKRQPKADGLILLNHGLITWGDTPEQAYEKHVALVSKAEDFVKSKMFMAMPELSAEGLKTGLSEVTSPLDLPQLLNVAVQAIGKVFGNSGKRNLAAQVAPVLRGLIGKESRMILEFDDSEAVLNFLMRPDLAECSQIGPATPDHLLYTKRFPLLLNLDLNAAIEVNSEIIRAKVADYRANYQAYFERNAPPTEKMLDPLPRIILAPGIGMWTTGKDARAARIVGDIYRHTIQIIEGAQALGGYATLSEINAYNAEYWQLELYKLSLLPKEKDLARQVAIVTGAASGIGRAIARRFAEEGAHVIVTDINLEGAQIVAAEIIKKQGLRRAIALALDVTDQEAVEEVVKQVCLEFGGVDILVSNAGIAQVGAIDKLSLKDWERSLAINTTGHFLIVQACLKVMKAQATGGSIVFNATKNVTAPGKDFGAYSVSKAAEAQLCRIVAIEGGEFGIRANMLNPDAIFEGSGLWTDEVKQQRAQANNMKVEELPEYYRRRNLLKVFVTAEDVAEAAVFLASARSAKTTGVMLSIDGGIKEAFPR